ncbi:MAG: hypothetical protein ACKO0W_10980 [Planctomycetota bacterium]
MSAFGPSPIVPNTPGAVQASFIAQQTPSARPRETRRPEETARPRREVRDEVRLSDPAAAQRVEAKPDAAEEWKHERPRDGRPTPRPQAKDAPGDDAGERRIDIKA